MAATMGWTNARSDNQMAAPRLIPGSGNGTPTIQEMALRAVQALEGCHGRVDAMTGGVGPGPESRDRDAMGLTGATMLVAELAERLLERLNDLEGRVGVL